MTSFQGAIVVVLATWLGWAWLRGLLRARAILRFAHLRGFSYFGNLLPSSLPVRDLPLNITSVWNVIDGECRGKRVVAFDCRVGSGRAAWRRTVIAIHAEQSSVKVSAFDPDMQITQLGEWTYLYRPKELGLFVRQLTPLVELSAYLEAI